MVVHFDITQKIVTFWLPFITLYLFKPQSVMMSRCLSPGERLDNANYLLSLLSNHQHNIENAPHRPAVDISQLIGALISLVHTDGVWIHKPTDTDQQVHIFDRDSHIFIISDTQCCKRGATNGARMRIRWQMSSSRRTYRSNSQRNSTVRVDSTLYARRSIRWVIVVFSQPPDWWAFL